MSTRELTLLNYYLINNAEASEVSTTENSLSELCSNNSYVIEKYKQAPFADGNFNYVFKIYNCAKQESAIKVGDWTLQDINSNCSWKPHLWLRFDLVDPIGNSCIDKRMPYIRVNHDQWKIYQDVMVGGSDIAAINRMLDLAKKASVFKSWFFFLESLTVNDLNKEYSNKVEKIEQKFKEVQSDLENFKQSLISN